MPQVPGLKLQNLMIDIFFNSQSVQHCVKVLNQHKTANSCLPSQILNIEPCGPARQVFQNTAGP